MIVDIENTHWPYESNVSKQFGTVHTHHTHAKKKTYTHLHVHTVRAASSGTRREQRLQSNQNTNRREIIIIKETNKPKRSTYKKNHKILIQ